MSADLFAFHVFVSRGWCPVGAAFVDEGMSIG